MGKNVRLRIPDEDSVRDVLKTWEEVHDWDDIVRDSEKGVIFESGIEVISKDSRCPHLRRLGRGRWFLYCEVRAKDLEKIGIARRTTSPTNDSSQYRSKIDIYSLQLWCLCTRERYEHCINFRESQKT